MSEPTTETVVVRAANDAQALIGRSIKGREIRQFRCQVDGLAGPWFEFRTSAAVFLSGVRGNDPHGVEVDALPPATEWVHLDDLRNRLIPGFDHRAYLTLHGPEGDLWRPYNGNWHPLTVVDHKVEVLVETPTAPEPDMVSVREALAALVQALDGQHETYPIIGWDDDAMVNARAALVAEGGER